MYNSNKDELISDLLLIYSDADMFSLTGPFLDNSSFERFKLSQKEGEEILTEICNINKEHLRCHYNSFNDEAKNSLPSFDELYRNIDKECQEFQKRFENGDLIDQSPYICDHFGLDTIYDKPTNLWHFYHDIQMYNNTFKKTIEDLIANDIERPIDFDFKKPILAPLYKNLVKAKTTFSWHCTTSSNLSIVYYFKFDEFGRYWLNQFNTVYDIQPLEDLAFYKNNELLFSSCTHERFVNHIGKV